jgi:hypothetical protein
MPRGANRFIGRAKGLVGAVPKDDGTCCDNAKSGPNGALVIGNEGWAGDGDSALYRPQDNEDR